MVGMVALATAVFIAGFTSFAYADRNRTISTAEHAGTAREAGSEDALDFIGADGADAGTPSEENTQDVSVNVDPEAAAELLNDFIEDSSEMGENSDEEEITSVGSLQDALLTIFDSFFTRSRTP